MRPAGLRRGVRHLRRADPVLARLVDQVGPCRYEVRREVGPFAYLTAAIVHQQLAGAAAATIHRRLCALAGRKHPRPEDIARLSDAELRGVGLSRQKIGYLRDLVARVEAGLPLGRLARLSDEAAIDALTSVKGIGRWTSEMFLMFRLGRLDVLPVDDLGIRKAMQRAFRKRALPRPDWMRKTAEPWRPYRSVACWYLWRSLDG